MVQQRSLWIVATALIGILPSPARPADHVLMIGGGPSAETSQLSIEQNMVYFLQSLGDMGRSDLRPRCFSPPAEAFPTSVSGRWTACRKLIDSWRRSSATGMRWNWCTD